MASNTPNLNLYKKDPVADGNDTFNITTMLNDNWDKIDTGHKENADGIDNLAGVGRTTETVKGNADDINNLAGAGRTIETVKGVADDLKTHKAEYVQLGNGGILGQSDGQSIPSNTVTVLNFNPIDNYIMNCTGSQITIKKTGVYAIELWAYIAGTTADGVNLLIEIDKNAASLSSIRAKHAPKASELWSVYQCVYVGYLAQGDILEAKLYHNASSAVNSQWSKIYVAWIGRGGV